MSQPIPHALARATLGAAAWVAATIAGVPTSAEAQYLDPGAGSIVVQAVIAVAIGVATTVKLYWHRISGFFRRRSRERRKP